MKIRNISLLNFRNYSKLSLEFGENMNIFIGDNAQGKTNILESIVVLALTKSHRIGSYPNIIQYNKEKCKISGTVKNNKVTTKLNIEMTEDTKKLSINNTNITKISDYISNLNVIIFTPEDIDIIKGSPNVRRNLLNIQLCQLSRDYLKTYNEYNRLLKTRNEYLKRLFNTGSEDISYLDVLTEKLIEKAIIIYQKRKEYIDMVNIHINDYFQDISDYGKIQVKYIPNIPLEDYDYESIRKKLKHILKKNYKKELNYGMTIYGPHRDDFTFEYEEKDLRVFGSQGQQKLAVLSFKLSEISIFEDITNTLPILLLDDIFGELDIKKRNKLLKLITNYDIQSIITTTDLKNIQKKYLKNADIYDVVEGKVERRLKNE